jgi:hypothetical protein
MKFFFKLKSKAKIDQYQRKLSIVNLHELESHYLEIIINFISIN